MLVLIMLHSTNTTSRTAFTLVKMNDEIEGGGGGFRNTQNVHLDCAYKFLPSLGYILRSKLRISHEIILQYEGGRLK